MIGYCVVIPTLGRPCLAAALSSLAAAEGPAPARVVLVDDRPDRTEPLTAREDLPVETVVSGGAGPAAARNAGWRRADTEWVVFLDDDIRVSATWRADLVADLRAATERVGAVQGRITVPLPAGRRPTDWERGTAGLATARWITADLAVRRAALADCGGFDERFPRAFREDADLALRLRGDGWELRTGERRTEHPVRPAPWWISVRAQAGNADDALMRALHGPRWHTAAEAPRGRRPRHLAITAAALAGVALAAGRTTRPAGAALGAAALAGIAEFAVARIKPGPATPAEVAAMAATSTLIPPLAAWHWLRGTLRWHGAAPWPGPPELILFDRDGTLIHDVPYNGDPDAVTPMPGAREALRLARERGVRVGVITNQSGVGRGLISSGEMSAVNAEVERQLGPFERWLICPHPPDGDCGCRKPAPGLVLRAAAESGVPPHRCAVIGDIAADVAAARAAGARGVMVPTPQTRALELAGVRLAADLPAAVEMLLGERAAPVWGTARRLRPGPRGEGAP